MPPRGEKLAKKEADIIRAWIDGGMLENKSSKAKKPSGPKIAKLDVDPSAKPEGPPPMPGNINLEPAVTSNRNTVVNDMACSPWAPLLAITGQKQVLLYNTDTLRLAAIIPFPRGFPETVSFHPTGKYLMAGGGIPGKSGTTYTWDVATGKMLMSNGREFDSVLAASLRLDLGGVALGRVARRGGGRVVHALGRAAIGFLGAGVGAALVGEGGLVAAAAAVAIRGSGAVAGGHRVACCATSAGQEKRSRDVVKKSGREDSVKSFRVNP